MMWRWVVLWQATALFQVGATIDLRFFSRRHIVPSINEDCIDYSSLPDRFSLSEGFRPKRTVPSMYPFSATYSTFPLLNKKRILARRIDRLLPNTNDFVKEHAKLVQDINGLKQIVFVKPFVEENRDYEDTIFNDIIEISNTPRPTPKPTTTRPLLRPTKGSSIPIILMGGESQHEVVRASPTKYTKPISLVGTSVSPLMKHPYPFAMHSMPKPLKICTNPVNMMYTTTQRPGLLHRLLNSILPRGR